jgi:hypothetical protein
MVVLGEKLSGGPVYHSTRLRVVLRVLFLRSSRVHPTLLMACERLQRTWTAHRKRTHDVCGLAWKVYVSCVSSFPL